MKKNVDFRENEKMFADSFSLVPGDRFTYSFDVKQYCLLEIRIVAKEPNFECLNGSK